MRTELVTALKRRATKIIAKLEDHGEPLIITQHGRPAACLMGIDAYNGLRQKLALLEGIARGERALDEGRVLSRAQARKRMARWLS